MIPAECNVEGSPPLCVVFHPHRCNMNIRKNTLSLERPRKYPKGCPNTI